VTDKESAANKNRLTSMAPEHVAEREFFFNALNNDPNMHMAIATSMSAVLEDLSAD